MCSGDDRAKTKIEQSEEGVGEGEVLLGDVTV